MTLKSYIWGIRFLTLLSIAAFAAAVYYVDPDSAGSGGKAIFFLTLFFALAGIFNLILLRLRKKIIADDKGENAHSNIILSFRQGILLACFVIGIFILQGLRMLVWWDGLLLLAGMFLVELYFLSKNN